MYTYQKTLSWGTRLLIAAILIAALISLARGHEIHLANGSVNYSNWINKDGKGCCNNQDCRPAKDDEVRTTTVVEVKVDGQWCPVLPHHYLKSGNAPDWGSAHLCVQANPSGYEGSQMIPSNQCHRLLCFQPKPQF